MNTDRALKWTAAVLIFPAAIYVVLVALTVTFTSKANGTPDRVAAVNGKSIRQSTFADHLRAQLWRRGETWDSITRDQQKAQREEALHSLINSILLAQFAAEKNNDPNYLRKEREDEFQQFLKQFPPPDEWKSRMQLQGLNEKRLRERIGQEVKQVDALERWLALQGDRVTESDARAWFESHKGSLTIPERVRASHIFLTRHDKEKPDREAEIKELHRKLTAHETTFEELAAKNSDDDSAKMHGGDLGWFTRSRVPPEFADKVFTLPVGEVSAPFASHLGWHILLVKEKLPARAATFEEMKDEITALLDSQWREAALKRLLDDLRAKAKIEIFQSQMESVVP